MIYSFRTNLLMRVWTGLLLLMVAMLIGAIVTNATTGKTGEALIAIILMAVIFIVGIMVLIGACRLLIAFFRVVLWK